MRRCNAQYCLLLTALAAACSDQLPTAPRAGSQPDALALDVAGDDTESFCNAAPITISAGPPGAAPPYPSSINVSGLSSGRFKVTVTLNRFSHSALADVDMLLAGPNAQTVVLMSDAGGSADFLNATVTFDDEASTSLPVGVTGVMPGGTYRPTNLDGNDFFASPAPGAPYGSSFIVFVGTDPNGTWKLFVMDDTFFMGGSIAGGWCVNIKPLNTAPIAHAGGPYSGTRGSPIRFDGTASADPDDEPIAAFAWTFGDGTTGTGPTPEHTYANGGTYEVTLVVTDQDGAASAVATTTATVSAVAPTATFSLPAEVHEGVAATVSLTSPSVAGVRYAFDCGAGFGAIGEANSVSCGTVDDGQLTVRGRVFDPTINDLFSEYTGTIDVKNVAPTALFTNGGTVAEGSPIELNLSNPVDVAADLTGLTYAFDCGTGTYRAPTTTSSLSCQTLDNGDLQVRGKVIDDDGGETEYSATVVVTNVVPTGRLSAPASVTEGSAIAVSLNDVHDPSSADVAAGFIYAFDCGAGYGAFGASNRASCPTTDNLTITVRARIRDQDEGETEYAALVNIANVAPVVTALTLRAAGPFAVGASIPLSAVFTDAGTADTHTATVELGAGVSVPGTVVEADGSGSVNANVSFAQAGLYTITVIVTDDDGASSSRSSSAIVIYDPTAGSVAGGGSFDSPVGALASNPALTGRATFALGAKYIHGGGTLVAHLEFGIKQANFNFRSTRDELLILFGGQAHYRGEGKVNGAGIYGFQVTAIDGGLIGKGLRRLSANDKIRIRIWNQATGVMVYDNQPDAPEFSEAGSPLNGGAIVIINR